MTVAICVNRYFQLVNSESLVEILIICQDFVCVRSKVAFSFPAERKISPNGHVGRIAVQFDHVLTIQDEDCRLQTLECPCLFCGSFYHCHCIYLTYVTFDIILLSSVQLIMLTVVSGLIQFRQMLQSSWLRSMAEILDKTDPFVSAS